MAKKETTTTTTSVDGKKYSRLMGAIDYDHEAVEELAEALNEIDQLNLRVNQLKQLVTENPDLQPFVWRTANSGTGVIALHKIENEHLSNIMMHLLRGGRSIPKGIRGEAMKRGITVPASIPIDWNDITEAGTKLMLDKWERLEDGRV